MDVFVSGREADEVAALLLSKGINAPKKLARVSVAELGFGSEVPGGVLATVRETLEKAVELKQAAAGTAPEHVNAGPLGAMPCLREPREEGQWVPGVRMCACPTVILARDPLPGRRRSDRPVVAGAYGQPVPNVPSGHVDGACGGS